MDRRERRVPVTPSAVLPSDHASSERGIAQRLVADIDPRWRATTRKLAARAFEAFLGETLLGSEKTIYLAAVNPSKTTVARY